MTPLTATAAWRLALDEIERIEALGDAERAEALARLGERSPELHARVQALLSATDEALPFGLGDADVLALHATRFEPLDLAGRELGPYRFVRMLGAGGMGQVWLAERTDGRFEGAVAVKLLAASTSPSLVERFRREGQLLGRLAHPNIARLLDAGALPSGQLYLVLEYVDGERLDQHCDARRLGIDERLLLFREVCAAVSHAHANLVVHRDLKPSNILVTAAGQVKLLDFGIAKLLDDSPVSGEETELTQQGGRAMTPEYAAPEQVNGGTVTTATDVYSLGVLLYGLLSGRRPYGDSGSSPAELVRAIVETDPPRLSAYDTTSSAPQRSTTPARLQRQLRGDLDTIVAKAMKKAPAERYASVQALSDDLQRVLDHQPVSARRDSAAYRARKFVRRHPGGVLAAGVAALALIGGAGGMAWQAQIARDEAVKASALNTFLLDLFRTNHPGLGGGEAARKMTAEQLLRQGAQKLHANFAGQPQVRAALADTLQDLMYQTDQYDDAVALGERELQQLTREHGADHPALIAPLSRLGAVLSRQNKYDASDAYLQRALALLDSSREDQRTLRIQVLSDLGQNAYYVKPVTDDTSLNLYRQVLRLIEDGGPVDSERHYSAYIGVARVFELRNQFAQAEAQYQRAIDIARKLSPFNHAHALQMYASMLPYMDRTGEGITLLTQAVEMLRASAGDNLITADAIVERGQTLMHSGELPRAVADFEAGLAMMMKLRGADDPDRTLDVQTRLAHIKATQGDADAAQALVEPAFAAWQKDEAQYGYRLWMGHFVVGQIAAERRQWPLAQRHLDASFKRLVADFGEDSVEAATVKLALARLQLERGEPAAARALAETVANGGTAPGGEPKGGALKMQRLQAGLVLAQARLAEGDAASARTLLTAMRSQVDASLTLRANPLLQAQLLALQAQAAEASPGCSIAAPLYVQARDGFESLGVRSGSARRQVASGLARCKA